MNQPYRPQQQVKPFLTARTRLWLAFSGVVILTLVAALIVSPLVPSWIPGSSFFSSQYPHLGLDLKGGAHLLYEADISGLGADTDVASAVEGARDVIERRVNALGVSEPLVQTIERGSAFRIAVELAGVTDVNEAIQKIGETPILEFKERATSTPTDSETLAQIAAENDEKSKRAQEVLTKLGEGASFSDLANEYSDDTATKNNGGDLGWVTKGIFTQPFEEQIFDKLGIGEITKEPVRTEFGFHIIRKDEERTNDAGEREVRSSHILIRTISLEDGLADSWTNTALSGKHLQRSSVIFDPQTNIPQVNLTFTSEGAQLFEDITRASIGEQIGIFLDGFPISAPVVQTVITGGEAVISGDFTLQEAKELSQRLNAGALPLPIKLVSQQNIGPSLGAESLAKSLFAGTIGLAAVALFMALYYLLPGLLAVAALAIYALISIALFELIPVTLTLAGIAGFILSIGMAVDANILIFERVKEELRSGVSFGIAIEEGFKRAWPSIRDSNVSSLLTCIILYWFGSPVIKGFAVTLGLGILVSMFSAISVTRTFLRMSIRASWVQKKILFGVRNKSV